MLAWEIKIWLFLTLIVIIVPLALFMKRYFWLFFWVFRNIYQKIEHKKNLDNIKKDIIEKKEDEVVEEIVEKVSDDNVELLNKKVERLRYQAIAQKDKWNLWQYEQILIEWLSYDRENLILTRMLADYYFSIWNHKKALPLLKRILESDTTDHKAIWQVWQIYLEKEDFQTAKLLVWKAIYIKNDNPKYYVTMAEIMYSLEQIKDAIDYMENAIKLRPQNVNYLLATASLYEDIWNIDLAKKYYFKVLETDQTNDMAKNRLNQI